MNQSTGYRLTAVGALAILCSIYLRNAGASAVRMSESLRAPDALQRRTMYARCLFPSIRGCTTLVIYAPLRKTPISATIPPTITQQSRARRKVMHANGHHFPAARPKALIFPCKKCYAFASSAAAS
nr:MAG TPA: hypothetical protein [Caudoviricetes sp.]